MIKWLPTLRPKTAPQFGSDLFPYVPICVGPCIDFKPMGELGFAQAYPVGFGERMAERVQFILTKSKGPFRFGHDAMAKRLYVEFEYGTDHSQFGLTFPDLGDEPCAVSIRV